MKRAARRRCCPALTLALVAVGCGLLRAPAGEYAKQPSASDGLSAVDAEEVREVHRLRALGDTETARAWVLRLTQRDPGNLGLRFLWQDVEIDAGGRDALLASARALAREEPGLDNLLAAARLESDPAAARSTIEQAMTLDPGSGWACYALAHREAQDGDWVAAGKLVQQALVLDPGHLGARRLETMVLARGGGRDEAIEALRRWLRNAARDPLQSAGSLDEARLDLAQLLILAGKGEAARAELAQLAQPELAGARVELVFAAVEQAQGRPVRALDAARAAGDLQPELALASVQEALLQEEWLSDPAAARAAWERVLAGASRGSDLGSVLLGLRARAALERLGASSGTAP